MPTCAAIKFWPTLNPTKPPTVHGVTACSVPQRALREITRDRTAERDIWGKLIQLYGPWLAACMVHGGVGTKNERG